MFTGQPQLARFPVHNSPEQQVESVQLAAGLEAPSPPRASTSASGDRQPLVLPYLDIYNLNLPYADDSNAVTPTSDELCNSQNTHGFLAGRRRLSSTASYGSRISHPSYGYIDGTKFIPGSRRSSFASHYSRHSYTSYGDYSFKIKDRQHREPTHFQWNTSMKNRATHPLLPEVVVDKTKSDDNVSSPTSQSRGEEDPGFPVGWRRQPYILVHEDGPHFPIQGGGASRIPRRMGAPTLHFGP